MGRPEKAESWYPIDVRLKRLWFMFDNETIAEVLGLHVTQIYRRVAAIGLPMRATPEFRAAAVERARKVAGPCPAMSPQRSYELRGVKMRKRWRNDPVARERWLKALAAAVDARKIHWNADLDASLTKLRLAGKTWPEIGTAMGINSKSCRQHGRAIGLPRYVKKSAAKAAREVGHPPNAGTRVVPSLTDFLPKTGRPGNGAASFEGAQS